MVEEERKAVTNLPKTPSCRPPLWWFLVGYGVSCALFPLALAVTIVMPPFVFLIPLVCIPAYVPHAKKLAWDIRDQAMDEDEYGEHAPRPWE